MFLKFPAVAPARYRRSDSFRLIAHVFLALSGMSLQAQTIDHSEHQSMDSDTTMQHHKMSLDAAGSVMNSNDSELPRDCLALGSDTEITVYAGREFADGVSGQTFGYSQYEFHAEPCSRVTVTLINNDEIRHQWMIHGLPKYVYPAGMFHIEAAGGATRSGTFIVPSDDRTYLVHCDMAQHMEKGMKAQLVVGKGSGDLWSVPGISEDLRGDAYFPDYSLNLLLWSVFSGVIVTVLALTWKRLLNRRSR